MKSEVRPLWVLGKALLLFLVVNIVFAWINPSLGAVSAYNVILPGRVRFPFGGGEDPYFVMVDNLDVMTASHVISSPKAEDEYRVVIIGDSSVWGENSSARESISEQWNDLQLQCDGRQIKFYNLGYPHPSVIKDLIILDKAMEYQPDMVVWFVTLNTLIPRRLSPFLAENSQRATKVLETYDIPFSHEEALALERPSFYGRTLMGRRSDLARFMKLQALGLLWAATGKDQMESVETPSLSPDVKEDPRYRGREPGSDLRGMMLFSALSAGHEMAKSVPIVIVNEPIYVASGKNSDIRYNDAYPRWAYDQYRQALAEEAQHAGWNYLDLWNAVPVHLFSDTVLHVSSEGERVLIQQINPHVQKLACP